MTFSIDLNILAALSNRDRFKFLRAAVPTEMIDSNTSSILNWYDKYFQQYPEHPSVDKSAFETFLRLRGNLSPEQTTVLLAVLGRVESCPSPEVVQTTINQLEELNLSGDVGMILSRYNNGDDIDLTNSLLDKANATKERMVKAGVIEVTDEEMLTASLEAAMDNSGIQILAIPALTGLLKGLNPGHNILIGADTNKGKTALLLRMAVDSAIQGRVLHPNRPVLYLINESNKAALLPRLRVTALRKPLPEIVTMQRDGTLAQAYAGIVGGDTAIQLRNIHGWTMTQVLRLVDDLNPFMVITDMTGRITANSNKTGGANDTAQLEEVWNTWREQATIKDFIHVGTAQLGFLGKNLMYPPLSALQLSTTGIQATLDLAILLGHCDTVPLMTRGVSTPKNKLARDGLPDDSQLQTYLDKEINVWS